MELLLVDDCIIPPWSESSSVQMPSAPCGLSDCNKNRDYQAVLHGDVKVMDYWTVMDYPYLCNPAADAWQQQPNAHSIIISRDSEQSQQDSIGRVAASIDSGLSLAPRSDITQGDADDKTVKAPTVYRKEESIIISGEDDPPDVTMARRAKVGIACPPALDVVVPSSPDGRPDSLRPETPDKYQSVRPTRVSQESLVKPATPDIQEYHPLRDSSRFIRHGEFPSNPLEMKAEIANLRRKTKGWENWLVKLQDIVCHVDKHWSEEVCNRISHSMLKPYPIECSHVCHHQKGGSKSRPWNYAAGSLDKGTDPEQCFYSDRPDRLQLANIIGVLEDVQTVLKFHGENESSEKLQSSGMLQYQALSAIESMVTWRRPDNCEKGDTDLQARARMQAKRLAEQAEAFGLHEDIKKAAGETPGSVTQQIDSHMVRKALHVLHHLRRHFGEEEQSSPAGSNASYQSLLSASLQNIHADMDKQLQQTRETVAGDAQGLVKSETVLTECCRRIRLFCMSGDQQGRAEEARKTGLLPLISKAMKEHRGSAVLQYEACFAAWVLCSHDEQSVSDAIQELELHLDIQAAARSHGRSEAPNVLRIALQAMTPLIMSSGGCLDTFCEIMQDTLWSQEHQCQAYRMLCGLFGSGKQSLEDAYGAANDFLPIIQRGMQEHIKSSRLQLEAAKAVYAMAITPPDFNERYDIARLALEPYKIYYDFEKASTRHGNKPRVMAEIVRTLDLLNFRCGRSKRVTKDTKQELKEKSASIRAHQVRGIRMGRIRRGS